MIPPSTTIDDPVTNEASSEARKRAALAISSGRPNRPMGMWVRRRWRLAGSANRSASNGVSIGPGHSELARIPCRGVLHGQLPGERQHAALAGRVGHLGRRRPDQGHEGGHVDDRSSARGQHGRHRGAAPEPHPFQVDLHDQLPCGQGGVQHSSVVVGEDPGVVDEHVDAAVGVDGVVDHGGDLIFVGHVDSDGGGHAAIFGDGLSHRSRLVGPDVGHHHPSSFGGEQFGRHLSDAAPTSRHDRHLALEPRRAALCCAAQCCAAQCCAAQWHGHPRFPVGSGRPHPIVGPIGRPQCRPHPSAQRRRPKRAGAPGWDTGHHVDHRCSPAHRGDHLPASQFVVGMEREAALVPAQYVDRVAEAGGWPLLIPPCDPSDGGPGAGAARAMGALDGLLLIGGGDLGASAYGHAPDPRNAGVSEMRDASELALLAEALRTGLPVLAVCRGAQLLNVHQGGDLVQYLPDVLGTTAHQPASGAFGEVTVVTEPGTMVNCIVGDRVEVPCSHHQAIATVGRDPGRDGTGGRRRGRGRRTPGPSLRGGRAVAPRGTGRCRPVRRPGRGVPGEGPPMNGNTLTVVDPATEKPIAELPLGGVEAVDVAVARARRAFPAWRAVAPTDRARLMRRFATQVEDHGEELAQLETANVGKPISDSRDEVAMVAEVLHFYAGAVDKHRGATVPVGAGVDLTFNEPLGVVAAIVPWNFPIAITSWKLGPALATGNTVVVKPAELTPLTALRLEALALEAGIPPGVAAGRGGDRARLSGPGWWSTPTWPRSPLPARPPSAARSWPGPRGPSSGSPWSWREVGQHRLRRRRHRAGCRRRPRWGIRQCRTGLLRPKPDPGRATGPR